MIKKLKKTKRDISHNWHKKVKLKIGSGFPQDFPQKQGSNICKRIKFGS